MTMRIKDSELCLAAPYDGILQELGLIEQFVEVRANDCQTLWDKELGNIVPGLYSPVSAKHSKRFSLEDALSIGVDRMQRNFDPMRQQVECWRGATAIGRSREADDLPGFIEGDLEVPKHLARRVHELYFNPRYQEFEPRTMWSLSNAFTSSSKNWTRFRSLRPLPGWLNFWRPGPRSRSSGRLLIKREQSDRRLFAILGKPCRMLEPQHPLLTRNTCPSGCRTCISRTFHGILVGGNVTSNPAATQCMWISSTSSTHNDIHTPLSAVWSPPGPNVEAFVPLPRLP